MAKTNAAKISAEIVHTNIHGPLGLVATENHPNKNEQGGYSNKESQNK
jgi:hypothetical protein